MCKKVIIILMIGCFTLGGRGIRVEAGISQNIENNTLEDRLETTLEVAAFANIDQVVLVYQEPLIEGALVGTLANGAKGCIVEDVDGFYKIESGNVIGYVMKSEVVSGKAALEMAKKVGVHYAMIEADTLYIRQQPNTISSVRGSLFKDTKVRVLADNNGWLFIDDGKTKGYVSKEHVIEGISYGTAFTLEELEKKKLEEKQSKLENEVVAFALEHLGNPYVYGGTSLTSGTDCSGFTQSVYANFGYSIPRSSREQVKTGREVSTDSMRPGDLIFYERRGRINHVALYIGEGKVVHASSPSTGIKVSNYDYRQPVKVVRIL